MREILRLAMNVVLLDGGPEKIDSPAAEHEAWDAAVDALEMEIRICDSESGYIMEGDYCPARSFDEWVDRGGFMIRLSAELGKY